MHILTDLAAQLADATLGAEVDETTFADLVDEFLDEVLGAALDEATALLGADAGDGPLGLVAATLAEDRLRMSLVAVPGVPAA